ncbi:unnamed protein product [Cuscuta epithymum]|uniref:Uncharacterized protein n=1 Tax=Cuscuta epithymum TaxID=186058 RepID=A0AAV0CHW0_9ASTE|nr:unnamed protein product [Cuscuta epithymum]
MVAGARSAAWMDDNRDLGPLVSDLPPLMDDGCNLRPPGFRICHLGGRRLRFGDCASSGGAARVSWW